MNDKLTNEAPTVPSPPTWQIALRWIAVIPGAILGMIAAGIALGVMNWLGSSRFGDDSWLTYIWQNGVKALGEGAAFTWAGALIAPSWRKATAIVLASIILFLSGASFFVVLLQKEWMDGWRLVATNIGAIWSAIHITKNGLD